MGSYNSSDYSKWNTIHDVPVQQTYILIDYLLGFREDYSNKVLSILNQIGGEVVYHNILDAKVHMQYPNLKIKFSADLQEKSHLTFYDATKYLVNQTQIKDRFICSFNGSPHVSRKLLTSALHKNNWFNDCCTKNFVSILDELDGEIMYYCKDDERFYRKFVLSSDQNFYDKIVNYGYSEDMRYDHTKNIAKLSPYVTRSFVHLVSETMATSYQPFITEKPFYSILTKGLWLAYAAPKYHTHLETYYGFKKYKIFDYQFDNIENPIIRLVELLTSLSKFATLSSDEWNDLYLMEKETLEFNYDHYMSRAYMNNLKKFDNFNC